MRRFLPVAVFAVFLFPFTALADLGPNLIPNPTFAGNTAGWVVQPSSGNSTNFTYPVAGVDGNAAGIKVTRYRSGDIFWQPANTPVTAGKQYQFSGYSLNSVPVTVIATYLKGTKASYATLGTVPAGSSWKQFTATITIPSGVTAVRIQHVIRAVGTLSVDNYALQLVNGTSTPPPPPPPPQSKPVISSFTANPALIFVGSSTQLAWVTTGASTTAIDQGVGAVAASSNKTVSPTATTTYTLTAANPAGTTTAQVTVNVKPAFVPPPAPPPPPPPAQGSNLITNGDFEAGTTAPTNWTHDFWGTLTAKFTYPVTGNGGGKAAQIQITNFTTGAANWIFPHVTSPTHNQYQYSEDYNANVATEVDVEFQMSNGTFQYTWIATLPPTSGWKTFTAQITPPPGSVSFTVIHVLAKAGVLTIDNASLTTLTDPFAQGMVTLAFDDGLLSQYQNALPMLNAAHLPATFYIITEEPDSGDTGQMSWAQIKSLATQGYEIGGHTRTHPFLTQLTQSQMVSEVSGSFNDLVAQGITPKTFAYPFGDVNTAVEAAVKNAGYTAARGSYAGQNGTVTDRYDLYDIRVDSTTSLASIEAYIDQAKTDKRWLVLELHDILASGGDEYAITPAYLQSLINYIKSSGVQVVTAQTGSAQLNP